MNINQSLTSKALQLNKSKGIAKYISSM